MLETARNLFIMKNPNKRELQEMAIDYWSGINFKNFINIYKNYIAKSYSSLVIDIILASDNPLLFRKNLLERI